MRAEKNPDPQTGALPSNVLAADQSLTPTLPDQAPVYAEAFGKYRDAGWRGVLPLPPGKKKHPPTGYTGRDGDWPSYSDCYAWAEDYPSGNVALRLPPDVIGIDVDHYDGKDGGGTLEALVAKYGPLPPTWTTGSRDDGVSGIRLYRVPEGLAWPGDLGGGIEVIQRTHRYAIVSPSIHPNGGTYRWTGPDGADAVDGFVPSPEHLAFLPAEWVQALSMAPRVIESANLDAGAVSAWLAAHGAGEPCRRMDQAAQGYAADLGSGKRSRHDTAKDATMSICHLAAEGHAGALKALGTVRAAFLDAVQGDRQEGAAVAEWNRAWQGAVNIAVGAMPPADPCTDPFNNLDGLIAPEDRPMTLADLVAVAPAAEAPGTEAAPAHRELILTSAASIKPRPVFWLWDGRLALGTLGLLAGRQGLGKSTLAYFLAAQITLGTLPGRFTGTPKSVLVCATEDSWEHTIVPRLMAAGADLERVYRVEVLTADEIHVGLSLPRDNHAVERAAQGTDAALLLLDPLISRLGGLDTHKDSEVRQALEPLVTVAGRSNMAVLGLIHHNKSATGDPLQSVMGSTAFSAVARSVHTVIADPDDSTEKRRLFGTPKNNLGRTDLPTLAFTVQSFPVPTESGTAWTGRIEWGEDHAGSIGEAMSRSVRNANDNDASATQEAAEWLEDFLTMEGPEVESAVVKAKGRAAGHSPSTLDRAKRKLNVASRSAGFPRTSKWSLPLKDSVTPQSHQNSRGDGVNDMTDVTEEQSRQSRQSFHDGDSLVSLAGSDNERPVQETFDVVT